MCQVKDMFTSAKIRNGSTYLASHLSANDYYAQEERVTGEWVGKGAGSLGLAGKVSPNDFEALRVNQRPGTEERLTPRTKETRQPTLMEAARAFREKEGRAGSTQEIANFRLAMKPVSNRVAFFDFQCSAPKSVSIMSVLVGDARLRQAHETASRRAVGELEQFAGRQKNTAVTRQSEITGNICAAAFTHDASRALDPQLHTHFVIANATETPNGQWYALNEFEMVKAVRYAGKVYQNELARSVRELGYEIREVGQNGTITGFEIVGVPDEICQRYSKRREEIEREIEKFERERGREPTVKEIALITRETRSPGLKEITTPEVHSMQMRQLRPEEWDQLQQVRLRAKSVPELAIGGEMEALRASVEHLFERQSVLKEHAIMAEALNHSLGRLDLNELKKLCRDEESGLVSLTPQDGLLAECATKQGLILERWAVSYVNATKQKCRALNPDFIPTKKLSPEQSLAVKAILSSKDRIYSFRGVAGAGKTTTLREVQRGLAEAGQKMFAITPTTSAAKVLHEEGFDQATTVEDFLRNGEKQPGLRGAVVICDEAGLKSNRQGAALLRMAERHDLRVILVGDVRQHVAVEAGDFLRVLETHSEIGRCEVGEIHRQIPQDYRAAITQMADGNVRTGLQALDRMACIKEGQSDYLQKAASDYLRLTDQGKDIDRCLAVSFTWDENHRFTEAIRDRLKENGVLPKQGIPATVHESLRLTNQQKRNPKHYVDGQVVAFTPGSGQNGTCMVLRVENDRVVVVDTTGNESNLNLKRPESFDVCKMRLIEIAENDKVLIRANDKRQGLVNGQVLTVSKVEPDGGLQTKEGIVVPREFRQWCHGYVVTSHKAQGRTTDHVVVAAETLTAKGAYVACSRGRQSCVIHTPDKIRLMERLPEGDRKAALDVKPNMVIPPALRNRIAAWEKIPRPKPFNPLKMQTLTRRGIHAARSAVDRLFDQEVKNSEERSHGIRM